MNIFLFIDLVKPYQHTTAVSPGGAEDNGGHEGGMAKGSHKLPHQGHKQGP